MRDKTREPNSRWPQWAFALLATWFLPYVLLGADAPVRIHDNLDSVLASARTLIDRDLVFSFAPVDAAMEGVPRSSLYSFFDLGLASLALPEPYWGYAINKLLMAIIGCTGMLRLLRKHVLPAETDPRLAHAAAVMYALLPFWSFNLTVAGIPLALCVLLDIRARQANWSSWLWLAVWTWSASLVLSGVFLLLVVAGLWLLDLLRTRRPDLHLLAALAFASASFLVSHAPLLHDAMQAAGPSHRTEFAARTHGFAEALGLTGALLMNSQDHAWSPNLALMPVVALGIAALRRRRSIDPRIAALCLFLLATALLYGFLHWELVEPLSAAAMRIVPLQLQRFHFLHPLAWVCLWVLCAHKAMAEYGTNGRRLVAASFLAALAMNAMRHECWTMRNEPGFRSFFGAQQFAEVRAQIGDEAERVRIASVGLYPCIALANGLRTLDGYFPEYPLQYKHRFREVIVGELQRSGDLERYFDDWGSRCYAFSAELGRSYLNTRDDEERGAGRRIGRLDYNWDAFRALGGRYLLSAVPIDDDAGGRLRLVREFRHEESAWLLRLYSVD
jgi:hypothetical protein